MGLRWSNNKHFEVKYVKRNMILALVFLTVGVIFYLDGLDDKNDYLRFSHGMWHLCCSVFGWYVFEAVEVTMKVHMYGVKFVPPVD
jgi:predicted membrane channel-forming protein YqfA (hemolysin III family)